MASKVSKEEDAIQVAKCLNDEIGRPIAAGEDAECGILKAADGGVVFVAEMIS